MNAPLAAWTCRSTPRVAFLKSVLERFAEHAF